MRATWGSRVRQKGLTLEASVNLLIPIQVQVSREGPEGSQSIFSREWVSSQFGSREAGVHALLTSLRPDPGATSLE